MSVRESWGPAVLFAAGVAGGGVACGLRAYELAQSAAALLIAGVASSMTVLGWRGPAAVWTALTAPPAEVTAAQRAAVRQAARGMVLGGIAIGLLAALLILTSFRLPEAERPPARLAGLAARSLTGPLAGVFLGRVWLGAVVDRLGGADPRADLGALLGAVAVAATTFLTLATPV